ncbi:MAG: hypothetical protein ACR2MT_12890 [Aurantibacter sp.]
MLRVRPIGKSILLFGAMALVIISCSKDNSDPINEDQKLSQTEVKTILDSDDYSSSLDTIISDVYLNDSSSSKGSNDCYVAEYTDTGFVIVFENCNVNGTDNVNGTLTAVYTSEGETVSFIVTWDDFYYGDIKLDGTRSYTLGANMDQSTISFSVTSDIDVTLADESVISENGTKTFALTVGNSLEDSVYTLEGNWTVEANGNTYKVIVSSSLHGNLACGYLNEGVMSVEKNGLVVTVDFGDGSCDDKASVKYPNGATEEVDLKD